MNQFGDLQEADGAKGGDGVGRGAVSPDMILLLP
jgi:hypothetical protein